eukprot:GHVU01137854.1.p3 GENE.GHVU01137854.1~~GHVU01137854.1.p3  ORF type:complete len:173 (-),score=29.80 GHVU01137854.1:1239-1757(-)
MAAPTQTDISPARVELLTGRVSRARRQGRGRAADEIQIDDLANTVNSSLPEDQQFSADELQAGLAKLQDENKLMPRWDLRAQGFPVALAGDTVHVFISAADMSLSHWLLPSIHNEGGGGIVNTEDVSGPVWMREEALSAVVDVLSVHLPSGDGERRCASDIGGMYPRYIAAA